MDPGKGTISTSNPMSKADSLVPSLDKSAKPILENPTLNPTVKSTRQQYQGKWLNRSRWERRVDGAKLLDSSLDRRETIGVNGRMPGFQLG